MSVEVLFLDYVDMVALQVILEGNSTPQLGPCQLYILH